MNPFKLIMIGAMYENGGNTTHRFLDGHPQLYVYPFESQLGSRLVNDPLTSLFPVKYRWPVFALDAEPEADFKAIIDEEGKVRSRTPHVSKFRHMPFDMNDDERMEIYVKHARALGRSRPHNVEAFFRATFEAWHDHKRSGREVGYVGYSPILGVDADKILNEMPGAHFIHVVRNPWSAYADTKKRPVPMSLSSYMLCWNLNQFFALRFRDQYPTRFHLMRIEDVLANPLQTLGKVCEKMGLEATDNLRTPSWNGVQLEEVYPWGTIRKASPEANLATARELSAMEVAEIKSWTGQYLDILDYKNFV